MLADLPSTRSFDWAHSSFLDPRSLRSCNRPFPSLAPLRRHDASTHADDGVRRLRPLLLGCARPHGPPVPAAPLHVWWTRGDAAPTHVHAAASRTHDMGASSCNGAWAGDLGPCGRGDSAAGGAAPGAGGRGGGEARAAVRERQGGSGKRGGGGGRRAVPTRGAAGARRRESTIQTILMRLSQPTV